MRASAFVGSASGDMTSTAVWRSAKNSTPRMVFSDRPENEKVDCQICLNKKKMIVRWSQTKMVSNRVKNFDGHSSLLLISIRVCNMLGSLRWARKVQQQSTKYKTYRQYQIIRYHIYYNVLSKIRQTYLCIAVCDL